ncbi:MAG TPA: NUDIX domain-containing protein [Cyclobacteriaceae bacterium]|nr:NUDIX domain-containing protein [Cyclobacteriaceae bacterium]
MSERQEKGDIRPQIKNVTTEVVFESRFTLLKVTNDYLLKDGTWQQQEREVFEKGSGASILLFNRKNRTVILIRQLRIPAYLNGDKTGMLIETCAGLLDGDKPEECARREALEETGYKITEMKKAFSVYISPGVVTEVVHCFVAPYSSEMKVSAGGGHDHEQENIEVMEIPFDDAYRMIETGDIKDAKTILLLQYAKINNLV